VLFSSWFRKGNIGVIANHIFIQFQTHLTSFTFFITPTSWDCVTAPTSPLPPTWQCQDKRHFPPLVPSKIDRKPYTPYNDSHFELPPFVLSDEIYLACCWLPRYIAPYPCIYVCPGPALLVRGMIDTRRDHFRLLRYSSFAFWGIFVLTLILPIAQTKLDRRPEL